MTSDTLHNYGALELNFQPAKVFIQMRQAERKNNHHCTTNQFPYLLFDCHFRLANDYSNPMHFGHVKIESKLFGVRRITFGALVREGVIWIIAWRNVRVFLVDWHFTWVGQLKVKISIM